MESAPRTDHPEKHGQRNPALAEFVIVCLCAEWCGVCREYREGFAALARQFPEAGFHWLDIEEHADNLGDIDVENFPTLLIKRRNLVLFYGIMLPTPSHLKRTLEAFLEQSSEESEEYAFSSVDRHGWQDDPDLRHLDAACLGRFCPQD
ncbi:MAG: thiol reductase thioredoxin [Candidatus Accumulibacter sp.]|jgi:thioredoxin 1|nr:thiol reductase thioredoxin [Accumulibacter sp.]MBN8514138.1 thiol reductase thioredoxin [Accumulibacter sp.]MQM33671.1 thiol reductase thioredoxin [Candidatus Accumulibacter phosphatis]